MCGFYGSIGSNPTVCHEVYEALVCLQHRGQDSAGIVSYDDRFHLKKGKAKNAPFSIPVVMWN